MIANVAALSVTTQNAGQKSLVEYPVSPPSAIPPRITFAVIFDKDRSGLTTVTVDALDAKRRTLATGNGQVTLMPSHESSLTVVLGGGTLPDGGSDNGCGDTASNPMNCGMCGRVCVLPNATAGCAMSACTVVSCAIGFADCDKVAMNGCEVNTTNDIASCGGCGMACALANATASCGMGTCAIASCTKGYADCDKVAANGCEIKTDSDPNNCGTCGNRCPSLYCTAGYCDKRIFVGSQLGTGALGGLAGADSTCQALANSTNLGGMYKAWLSTSLVNAADRLTHGKTNYRLVDGTIVASNWAGLVSGNLMHAINKTQFGGPPPTTSSCNGGNAPAAWTDTNPAGMIDYAPWDCAAWSSNLAGDSSAVGDPTATSPAWTGSCGGVGQTCNSFASLYCVEQ